MDMYGISTYHMNEWLKFYGKCRKIYHTWILWVSKTMVLLREKNTRKNQGRRLEPHAVNSPGPKCSLAVFGTAVFIAFKTSFCAREPAGYGPVYKIYKLPGGGS